MDKANLIISMANLTTIRIKKIRKIVNKTNTVIYINQTSPMSTIDPKDTVNLNSMATYKIISMRATNLINQINKMINTTNYIKTNPMNKIRFFNRTHLINQIDFSRPTNTTSPIHNNRISEPMVYN